MAQTTLSIRTTLSGADAAEKGIRNIGAALKGIPNFAADAGRAMQKFGDGLQKTGQTFSLYVTAPILAGAAAVTKLAIDAEESENLFNVAMGSMADEARAFSEEVSAALGLNQYEFRKTMGVINQMTSSMGLSTEASFAMSKGIALLANDMASFFNLRPEEAFEKLTAGLTGEIEPLKRLGILVNEAATENALLTRGLIEQGQELDEVQKVMGRYLAVLDQTANAQGDLARTLESPANMLRLTQSRLEEIAIEMGQAFFPVVVAVTGFIQNNLIPVLQQMVEWWSELSPATQTAILAIGGIVTALGPLLVVMGLVIKALGTIVLFLSSKFVAAVTIAGGAIAVLVGAALGIATAFETVAKIVGGFMAGIALEVQSVADQIRLFIFGAVEDIVGALSGTFIGDQLGLTDEFAARVSGVLETIRSDAESNAELARIAWGTAFDNMANAGGIFAQEAAENMNQVMSTIGITTTDIENAWGTITGTVQRFFDETGVAAGISAEEIQALYANLGSDVEDAFRSYTPAVVEATEATSDLAHEVETVTANTELLREMSDELSRAGVAADNLDLAGRADDASQDWERFQEQISGAGTHAGSVLLGIKSSFQNMIVGMVQGTASFSELFKTFWTDMVSSVLAELARLAANEIFQILFLGGSPSGGGGLGGLFGGGGGLLSLGLQAGLAYFTGGGSLFASAGSAAGAGAFAAGAAGPPALAAGGGGFGSLLGLGSLFFQTGGSAVVTRPTLIMAGETGPEQLSVRPLASGVRSGGQVVFQGINIIDDLSLTTFERRISRATNARAQRSI